MLLSAYSGLIRQLPYLDQAFETKKGTWDREHYQEYKDFDLFLRKTFITGDSVILSREDLFNEAAENVRTAIFSIIFWGYPRNMRGNAFKAILDALPEIEKILSGTRELDAETHIPMCANGSRVMVSV
jgi:hypothetical protein